LNKERRVEREIRKETEGRRGAQMLRGDRG